ncbi:MAG: hypothetical protein DRJ49_00715 [Thermoprotei archaeon]|nr:MAG: hypothetical protein DRJ49_00715 [Thermoprotei archaeon]
MIVKGSTGERVELHRVGGIFGVIYVRDGYRSLRHNAKVVSLEEDLNLLKKLSITYNLEADPKDFTKVIPISPRPFYVTTRSKR